MICRVVREAASGRATYVVAENETQEAKLVRSATTGGYGIDALWNDDFHHTARVAMTGRTEAYYSNYKGSPQEFISAIKKGYLYQGQWYPWQRRRRGSTALDIAPDQFVVFLQNHDQIANSLHGFRGHQLTSPGRFRALTGLLLLSPATPMLFQGEEFAASAPFLYFADHEPELAREVARGRWEFLRQFPSIAATEPILSNTESIEVFQRCKLDLSERETHAQTYALHRDLLKLRREDAVFGKVGRGEVDGAVLGPEAFVLRFFGRARNDRLVLVNLGIDLNLESAPEPLLAPPQGSQWSVIWSSEAPCYAGGGTPPIEENGKWQVPGQATVALAAIPLER